MLWSLGRLAPAAPARALPLQPWAARKARPPPPGPLKETRSLSPRDPPEAPVPWAGKRGRPRWGRGRAGGGAAQGRTRGASEPPQRGFSLRQGHSSLESLKGVEGRVRIPNLESGCSKALGSLREGGTDRLRSGAQKSLWPPGGWPTVQLLWPGGVLDPKGSRCPVAAGSLGQIIQAQLFWALNPWTSYGPSPGKCPSCTVRCTHILTSTKVRVHTRLCKCIRGFPGPSPGARLSHAALAITGPPHGWRKPVHTHPLPRGHIRPEMDPAGLSRFKAATDPAPAA